MKKGWYILNYHDISWEENSFIRGIGGSFSPDIFSGHLQELSRHTKLISVQEGFERYSSGDIDEPLVSFWFDDGFAGVREYAMPLMDDYDLKGAISINSRFMLRQEMFWRSKLSYLSQTDGLRFLRSRLRKYGYTIDKSVKEFTMNRFSLEIVEDIDSIYRDFCAEYARKDAFRIFDTVEGIRTLYRNGWEISNHSSAHYPISEDSHIGNFKSEFDECEEALCRHLDIESRYWVVPFDRQKSRSLQLFDLFEDSDDKDRSLVLVGNRFNQTYNPQKRIIHRIDLPYLQGEDLVRYLRSIPSSSN
ncbi:MAG: polysaccharide deacetylase family protein [Campylobacterota bacterium]|nr:polysaccharide deacetylase family protein [Campylobacterota bacterium]